jgi:pimeloyl-ACP methyl ester carboxylesterase
MSHTSVWPVGELRLSGTDTLPASAPRATIVALHGGGYSAGYWEHPLDPAASLVTLGPALGYRVVAIDRPGYGASHGLVGDEVRMARQAEIVLDLVDGLRADTDTGAAIFLIGHSMGSVLALHMAASARGSAIAAVEISGLPFVFDDSLADKDQLASLDFLPANGPEYRRDLFYGPDGTFDPDMIAAEERLIRPIPAAEIIDAVEGPQSTPALAPKITVPVQVTRADFDASSGGGRQGLERCGGLFTSSPRVVLAWQRASGHNISLHRVARAYHLRAVAFFDDVLAGAQQPPVT